MAKNLRSRTGVPQPTNFVVPSWVQRVMHDFLVKQAEGGECSQECSAFQPAPVSTEARSPQHHPQQRVASTHGAASHSASFSSCLLCALNSLLGELLLLYYWGSKTGWTCHMLERTDPPFRWFSVTVGCHPTLLTGPQENSVSSTDWLSHGERNYRPRWRRDCLF